MPKTTITTTKTAKRVEATASVSQEFKDILNRIRRGESYMRPWHDNIARWRRLYNLDHYNTPTKQTDIHYNDPTYTNTVDLAVGIMLGNDVRFHSYGFSPSVEEQKNTGAMEKLIAGIIQYNDERTESQQIYELFLNFNRDGGGCIYSPFDPEIESRIEDLPNPQTGGKSTIYAFKDIPLIMETVDPLNVIGFPGGPKRWMMIGRKEKRSVLDIEIAYNLKLARWAGYTDEQKSETYDIFYDIWDFVWVAVQEEVSTDEEPIAPEDIKITKHLAVRNTIVFANVPILGPRIMPGYSDLPYTIQFFNPSSKDPKGWKSILSPLESSVMMLERTFNRRAKQIDIFTALPMVVKTQPGRGIEIDAGLYNSIQISPDESIEFAKWPGNPPEVELQLQFLRTRIQQSGFSDVMFGSGTSQIAGYALSQLGDQNRIRLNQPIKHLELLLTAWAKKAMELIEYFAEDTVIYVYGKNRGEDYVDRVMVEKLRGYSVRAEIRPNFPNEEMRKVAMSTQVKGLVSDYTRMEKYLGIEQPEDENERKIIEAAYSHPLMLKYGIMSKLQEAAEAGDAIAALVLQGEANQAASNQQGRPTEPNNPEQLTSTQSPTGQPVPQALGEQPGATAAEALNNEANVAPDMTGGVG